MEDLTEATCEPCEGQTEPMDPEEAHGYLDQLDANWSLVPGEVPKIDRVYEFEDFEQAIRFVNETADIAEREAHHPNLAVDYDRVTVTLWTHAIDGLSRNDFILAAKLDRAARHLRAAA